MAREIYIPNSAVLHTARHVLGSMDWKPGADEVTVRFHDRWCHMQPWVMSTLGAWALAHRASGGVVRVENAHRAGYAWRFGLQHYFNVDPGTVPRMHEEAGRFIALRTVKDAKDLAALLADIVPMLHIKGEATKGVLYAMSEMVRNTLEHSGSAHGAVVSAQHFRGARGRPYVSIGIADTGIGIRSSLNRNHPTRSDKDAILKAIEAGVSGAPRGADNAGAGLFITRRLSQATRGYFAVGSGTAMFRSSRAEFPKRDDRLVLEIADFPGTIVSVEIGLDDDSNFEETLSLARDAFGERVKERRKEVAMRVKFR